MSVSAPLLATKLYFPPARPTLVPRPRLTARVADGLTRPLTLISAPPGYGKTTLLSEWHSGPGQGFPIAWLSLDAGDNDPARFLNYLAAALDALEPGLAGDTLPLLHAAQLPPSDAILTSLINDLSGFPQVFALVLDDYQTITAEAVHEAVAFLLDHIPPHMRLVILTRSDPPLPLARLRARGQLSEIRGEHLRFTPDEAAAFLERMSGVSLSADDVAALEARTEGWVAGLQMAALSLQDAADPHAFVTAFRGDDRYVADYLLEEVLQRQPVEFQQFLMQTAVLDRLNAPLCDAVTGRRDSQAVLNALERANLFLVPLDSRREWFRYHHLFASLLRQRLLDAAGPDAVHESRRRVWQWHADHGLMHEAVDYALACGDYDPAGALIEQLAQQLFMGNELNTLLRWSESLPAPVIAARPRLNLMVAWAAHATGHPQHCERFVELVEQAAGTTIDDFLQASPSPEGISPLQKSALIEAAVIRSRLSVDRLDMERVFALGERVLPYLTRARAAEPFAFNPPHALHGPQLFMHGLAHKFRGDLPAAVEALREAYEEARENTNPHIIAVSLGHLGEALTLQGRLRQAEEIFRRALEAAQAYPPHSSAFFGMASVGLGNLAYEHNDLEAAFGHLQDGLELGRLWNSWECLLPGYVGLARGFHARGEHERAFGALDDLLARVGQNAQIVRPTAEAWRALLALRQGDTAAAVRWAATFDPAAPDELRLRREQSTLVLARLWLAQGKATETGQLLERLLAEAEKGGRQGRVIEIACLQALSLDAQRQRDAALRVLRRALELAAPEGYLRLFVDEGEQLRLLIADCRLLIEDRAVRQYADTVVAAFGLSTLVKPAAINNQKSSIGNLVEPLSDRELEVLRLMAQGLSNPEIARKLYLSPNTLKAHSQNIYQKLDVHSRMEAVNRARALGLL